LIWFDLSISILNSNQMYIISKISCHYKKNLENLIIIIFYFSWEEKKEKNVEKSRIKWHLCKAGKIVLNKPALKRKIIFAMLAMWSLMPSFMEIG